MPLVGAELSLRFPGRELRAAEDPEGLRTAWAALERTWVATVDRATAMPAGTIDASVDREWSLAETLRHLVMAADTWLGRGILGQEPAVEPSLTRRRVDLPLCAFGPTKTDASVRTIPLPLLASLLIRFRGSVNGAGRRGRMSWPVGRVLSPGASRRHGRRPSI